MKLTFQEYEYQGENNFSIYQCFPDIEVHNIDSTLYLVSKMTKTCLFINFEECIDIVYVQSAILVKNIIVFTKYA